MRLRFGDNAERAARTERWFVAESDEGIYGWTRDVVKVPDGALCFLTNNSDVRGAPRPGDDKNYRVAPKE